MISETSFRYKAKHATKASWRPMAFDPCKAKRGSKEGHDCQCQMSVGQHQVSELGQEWREFLAIQAERPSWLLLKVCKDGLTLLFQPGQWMALCLQPGEGNPPNRLTVPSLSPSTA